MQEEKSVPEETVWKVTWYYTFLYGIDILYARKEKINVCGAK